MRYLKRISYLLFISLILVNCNRTTNSLYEFDPRGLIENKIKLADIASDIQYIPLDNNFPISIIYKYEFVNNSIYLSAKDIGILEYNRLGQNPKKIGSIGRGPGEYLFPMKFAVDNNSETVYVNDIGGKIHTYSKTGNYLKTISTKEKSGSTEIIQFYNSKLFLFNFLNFGDAEKNWVILDTLGQIIGGKERTTPIFKSNWNPVSGTYFFNNNLHYWNPYNDTIFRITPELKTEPSLLFAQAVFRLPKSDINLQNLSQYLHIRNLFESHKYFIIFYIYNKNQILALIEKKAKKSYLSIEKTEDSLGITNNFDGGLPFFPKTYFKEDDNEYMVGIVYPHLLKLHVSSYEFLNSTPEYPEKKNDLKKLADALKNTDNPVFMIIKLKK